MKRLSAYVTLVLFGFIFTAFFCVVLIETTSALPSGSIVINQGASYTTSREVTLTVSYSDNSSQVSKVRYSSDGLTWGGWENPSPTKAWTLTSGDGTKTVYYAIRNQANDVSPTYSDTIILDTQNPIGSVLIANGTAYTNKTSVNLTLTASDATSGISQMILSNDGLFDTEQWETFASSKTWVLTSNDQLKTVWVKYKDTAGLESNVCNDTISLDATLPSATVLSPTEEQVLTSSNVTATWSSSDFGSGIDHCEIRLDVGNWINKGTSGTHTFTGVNDGNHSISLRVIDKAGNSREYERSFAVFQSVQQTLTVTSLLGSANPPRGNNYYVNGQTLVANVSSPVTENGTVWACSGWIGTGSVPAIGNGSSVSFVITQNSTITWSWQAIASYGNLVGSVRALNGTALSGVTVQYSGQVSGSVSTDLYGNYTVSDLLVGNYSVTAFKNGFILQTKQVYVNAGATTAVDFQLVSIDTSPPSTPVPDDGVSGWSNDNTPTFTWSASIDFDNGVAGYYWRIDGGSETWTTSTNVTLGVQSYGSHIFEVRAKDNAGNLGSYGSHVFQIDTTPPPGPVGSISINGGATYATTSSVNLVLNYSDDASEVRYSNDGTWDSEAWEAPSSTKAWTLIAGEGMKTVYYQIKDNAGLVSTTYSDTISLDSSLPSIPNPDDNVYGWSSNNKPTLSWLVSSDTGSGVAGYYWKVDNGPETWTTSTNVTLPSQQDGTHTFYVKAKDNAGNNCTYGSHPFQIDTAAPIGTISINQGAQYTTSTAVTLTLTFSDVSSGVDKVRLSNDGIWDTEQWEPPTTTKSWALSVGDGTKTVYFQIRDAAGLMSLTSDDIILNTGVPTGSILINGGAMYATTTSVSLTLTYSTDVSQARYSNDGVWDTEQWETPSLSKIWSLTAGDGVKMVYYQVKNNAGTVSPVYSASIKLDTTSPTGSITIAGGATYTDTATVSLTLTASDGTSGVSQMRLSNDGVFDMEQWETNAASKSWTLTPTDGEKTVYVQFKDNAGLVSSIYSNTITLRTPLPTGSIIINSDAKYATSTMVTLTLTYAPGTSASRIDQVRYSNDDVWDTEKWESPSSTKAWTLVSGDGVKRVYYQLKDNAGIVSTTYSDTINLDTTLPSTPTPNDSVSSWSSDNTPTFAWTDSSDSGSDVAGYYWKVDNGAETWINYTSVTLTAQSDGNHTFYVRAKDNAGNIGDYGSHAFQIDTSPPSGSILINRGAAYAVTTSVNLTLTYDNDVIQVRYSNDGIWDTEQWENPSANKTWNLTYGDAIKTVYVQFMDKAGLESSTFSDAIILDTTPPTGSVKINNDSPETASASVALTLTANDTNGVIQMRFSNDGSSWFNWEDFSETKSWTIASGNGTRTVYAQFRDAAELDSSVCSDTINLVVYQPSPGSSSSSSASPSPDISFTDFGNLVILVKDPGDNPISGAEVVIVTTPQNQSSLSGVTNSTGYVAFSNLQEGSYSVRVSSGDFQIDVVQTSVTGEETTFLTATLKMDSGVPSTVSETQSSNGAPQSTIPWQIKTILTIAIAAMGVAVTVLGLRAGNEARTRYKPEPAQTFKSDDET